MLRLYLRLALLVLAFALFLTFAPAARADEPSVTGAFSITAYNYIDEGGAWCASWARIPVGAETDINHFWPEFTRPFAGINTSNYMICWEGWLNFPVAGSWTVHTVNDDGMDVYVDNQLVMNGWYDQGPSLHDGSINLSAGTHHVIVKYYNRTYGGTACVAWGPFGNPIPWWQCPSQKTVVVIQPQPVPVPCYTCVRPVTTFCYYRVKWGDTLSSIARRYGTNYWTLAQFNHLPNPNCIYAGMLLKIPNCN